MSVSERIPFQIEVSRIIDLLAKQIYQDPLALLRENSQNAYDAILQRMYLRHSFEPEITISITPTEVQVVDNGIGMTKDELKKHFWKAGASGKNTSEAREAGVVGTFGIGAMANFGIATELTVHTESVKNGERTISHATRETLSTSEDCIEITTEKPKGEPGTTIIAKIPEEARVNVDAASAYIIECARYLPIPVQVNGQHVSQEHFGTAVEKPPAELEIFEEKVSLGPELMCNIELAIGRTGEAWVYLTQLYYSEREINGELLLRQGTHQIRTFRSKFALATTAVRSLYNFGGIANIDVLEPTAGREALTTESLQILQTIITQIENYVSEKISESHLSNSNTSFMEWAAQHSRLELCSKLMIRMEPDKKSMPLERVRSQSQISPMNYYDGSDPSMINTFATEDQSLLVVSTKQPRRKCELGYLQKFCQVTRIVDSPTILERKPEINLTLNETALALRLVSILEADYFVNVRFFFGKISHGLPMLVDTSQTPIEIVLDADSPTVSAMLQLYSTDYSSMTGMMKDFVRSVIFPKLSDFVPSSTRQGAEAFLKAIQRPREIFEYEKADLGSLTEIWQDYVEGIISMSVAARKSSVVARASVQVLDQSATESVASVIPDVLEHERILEQEGKPEIEEDLGALPAITRLEKESSAKLLMIEDAETPLKGYRCFIAVTDRVRKDQGEFFLQPHRTEIVWGGQKALYIFQHHSGRFGLYYELQGAEVFSVSSGGRSFPTCTIFMKNRIYIPIPDEIRPKFIPQGTDRKRFEIRCNLLYPDTEPYDQSEM